MNKYKLKIVPESGKFVGYVLENDEVRAKTEPCQSSSVASRNLSILMASLDSSPTTNQPKVFSMGSTTRQSLPSASQPQLQPQPPPSPSSAPRRCCGRG